MTGSLGCLLTRAVIERLQSHWADCNLILCFFMTANTFGGCHFYFKDVVVHSFFSSPKVSQWLVIDGNFRKESNVI